MNKIKILVAFDLPDLSLKKLKLISPKLEVEKSNKEEVTITINRECRHIVCRILFARNVSKG